MPLSPRMYHWVIRPRWLTQKYIHDHILDHFRFDQKHVLDFGSGTGANCSLCEPNFYLGIEPDIKRIELARRLYPNHRFMIFDEQQIPVQNNSIDYIIIVAVLHHISDDLIKQYLLEFNRILKPGGKIIIMEPYLCERAKFNNRFMNWYDDGNYIRNEIDYLNLFRAAEFDCTILKKFKKCFVYNELFFLATPQKGLFPERFYEVPQTSVPVSHTVPVYADAEEATHSSPH